MKDLKESTHNIHDWCFVSGRVNALENSLLTYQFFEKLLDTHTFDDFSKQLRNSKLKDCFTTQESLHDYEKLIDAYFCDNVNEIKTLSPSTEICDFFLLKYKLQDLKNYLKNKISGVPVVPITFYVLKSQDMEYLWGEMEEVHDTGTNIDLYNPEQVFNMPEVLCNGIGKLKTVLHKNNEVLKDNIMFIVDLVMDNAYLCYMAKMCEYFHVEYAKVYLKKLIFVNVVKSLFRTITAGCNIELIKKHYLQGHLHNECFLDLLKLPIKEWKETLNKELPLELVENIVSSKAGKRNPDDFTKNEIQLDNYLLDIVKHTKYIAFGPERVFGYLCGLDSEIYNLKLLIGGKINKIDNESIKDRMRNTYV